MQAITPVQPGTPSPSPSLTPMQTGSGKSHAPTLSSVASAPRSTSPCNFPVLPNLEIFACFRGPRIGGDFFDVVHAGNYLFLAMTDIAGERDTAQRIAAEVQDAFRQHTALSENAGAINETEVAVDLLRAINGAIMSASGGVRCAPTFLAIYNLSLHLLTYISAGAPAALLLANGKVQLLESAGIPLGLFTHLTHDPYPLAVESGARLVLVSKGVLEATQRHQEFGIDRVRDLLLNNQTDGADTICQAILTAAEEYGADADSVASRLMPRLKHSLHLRDQDQDMTVLTLARL